MPLDRQRPAKATPPAGRQRVPGRFAYDGLDRVMHEKARLGILTSLVAHPAGLLFNDLKDLCALTDGNLSRHLDVLVEARLVEIWKGSKRGRPQTLCRLTKEGRRRFLDYIGVLESVVADAARLQAPASARDDVRPGLVS
jgi:DNA-binding transcriptional ArsR family regulator